MGNAPGDHPARCSSAFPAQRGSYLLGVLARIGWFTPTLIQLRSGADPGVRRARSGCCVLRAHQLAAASRRQRSGAAQPRRPWACSTSTRAPPRSTRVLVDSRLVHKFALTGAMALRARLGLGPKSASCWRWAGSIRASRRRPAVPPLARVRHRAQLGQQPAAHLRGVLAHSPPTPCSSARSAELYAERYGFSVTGDVGFDVLVQIAPLHFIADFHASVQLKHGSTTCSRCRCDGELEGPRPLRVSGKASFSRSSGATSRCAFDKTLIDGEQPPPPPAVDVLAELKAALADGAELEHAAAGRTRRTGWRCASLRQAARWCSIRSGGWRSGSRWPAQRRARHRDLRTGRRWSGIGSVRWPPAAEWPVAAGHADVRDALRPGAVLRDER